MAQKAPSRTRRQRRRLVVVGVLLAAVVVGLGLVLRHSQSGSRRQLEDRVATRAELAGRFVNTYATQVLDRERVLAEATLTAPDITAARFDDLVASFGFQAAVLLDGDGRLIHAVPTDSALIGQKISDRYDHLRAAVDGHPAISKVVPSAVKQTPVVAFATPFDTPQGRRVFSGGYEVANTPLGAFLRDTITVHGTVLYLLDPSDAVVASSESDAGAIQQFATTQPELAAAAAREARGHFQNQSGDTFFVSTPVVDTNWRLVVAIPSSGLLAPLNSGRFIPWFILAAAALLGALAIWMTLRVVEARERRDIEQAVALEREREVVATLQQLSEARRDFVHAVSHDLRTPLTSIMGFLEMLQDGDAGPLEDRQADMVDAVARNANRLARLVEDLLDVARLNAAPVATMEPVAMGPLLDEVWADAKGLAAGRDLQFERMIAPIAGLVIGEASQLERVLLNLLSNAIKFTPDGGTVTLTAFSRNDTLTVEVRDTGTGISTDDQAQLFQPFFRSARTRNHVSGTGLGLAVVAGIVGQHSGTVAVDSMLGRGTTMRVQLPLAPTPTPAATTAPSR